MEWRFLERRRGIIRHNSNENTFFDADEIGRSDALIRETIQNSMDARIDRVNGTARVTFKFVPPRTARFDTLVRDLRPRLEACELWHGEAGLGGTGALVIEDFGTTGLTGSTADDADGNFAYFWRCIGESAKTGSAGGRWGVGKRVFTDASHLCAVFGLTIRSDDKRQMLLGQAILKGHKFESTQFFPYGFYAEFEQDGFQLPSEDHETIESFKNLFRIERKNESGLSLVIPCPDGGITEKGLIEASVLNYFFPILAGTLVVEVNDQEIDSNTIEELILNVDPRRLRQTFHSDDVKGIFKFIRDVLKFEGETIEAKALNGGIVESSFDLSQLNIIRERFQNEETVAVKVPLSIKKYADISAQSTSFDIYLRRAPENTTGTDLYVRGNLTLPEEHWLHGDGVLGMLIANNGPISEFLGDAEKPSHKKWTESKEDWQRKYERAKQTLRDVRKSVRDLAYLLDTNEDAVDKDILGEFFNAPKPETDTEPRKKRRRTKKKIGDVPPKKPQILQTYKVDGGFRVTATDKSKPADFPRLFNVRVAYDRS